MRKATSLERSTGMNKRRIRLLVALPVSLIALYLLLLIPGGTPPMPDTGEKEPFVWNQDEYWSSLEDRFKELRSHDCAALGLPISSRFSRVDSLLAHVRNDTLAPGSPLFSQIEDEFFNLAVLLAACPDRLADYITTFSNLRTSLKSQSIRWHMSSRPARDCLYRLLYGGRTAVEEVMLQSQKNSVPALVLENAEPSVNPAAEIYGVSIHSGDILVSRGGAPTSALIARGNDYPGNFSHVALVHIDDSTKAVSIIEAHIEKGVAVATVDDYLQDTKLRIMVLRLRANLPALQANPMLPHKAAEFALRKARTVHTPYDFEMDFEDHSELFCSEVVSEAYEEAGITLWMGLSHISSIGVKSWLSAFGVQNFVTQEPSDLEYDPQLTVVAEWRDFETLYKDRIDNAVVDIMLEGADNGDPLDYDLYMLPLARVLKAYSFILNQFDRVGPVPEGMSATAALRNKWFSERHAATRDRLIALASQSKENKGYSPPYWELVKLARVAYSD